MKTLPPKFAEIPAPLYTRVPAAGTACPLTGLRRTKFLELVVPCAANNFQPPVASRVVKTRKDGTRGVRLVSVSSLIGFIESQS